MRIHQHAFQLLLCFAGIFLFSKLIEVLSLFLSCLSAGVDVIVNMCSFQTICLFLSFSIVSCTFSFSISNIIIDYIHSTRLVKQSIMKRSPVFMICFIHNNIVCAFSLIPVCVSFLRYRQLEFNLLILYHVTKSVNMVICMFLFYSS